MTTFWQATQFGGKLVFWQQITAICLATTRNIYFSTCFLFIFIFWVFFSVYDIQSEIHSPHTTILYISWGEDIEEDIKET